MLAGTCARWPADGCRSVPRGAALTFALDVLKRTKTEGTIGELLGYSPQAAAEKLIAGDIDATFVVHYRWNCPAVQALINAKGVELASFPRADAMVALYPFLTKLSVPRGIFDIAADLPPSDVVLLASKSILAVRAKSATRRCNICCLLLPRRFIRKAGSFKKQDNSQ